MRDIERRNTPLVPSQLSGVDMLPIPVARTQTSLGQGLSMNEEKGALMSLDSVVFKHLQDTISDQALQL